MGEALAVVAQVEIESVLLTHAGERQVGEGIITRMYPELTMSFASGEPTTNEIVLEINGLWLANANPGQSPQELHVSAVRYRCAFAL